MSKTIVNIITEDNPVSAYLFIREMYRQGDRLMYISAKDTEEDLDALSELFSIPQSHIEEVVLKHDMDELSYEKICRTVRIRLSAGTHYCVNLAGGTRYMSLAVQQVFESFSSEFFYLDVESNMIVKSKFDDSIYDNDDVYFPIRYRMSIGEYFRIHLLENDMHNRVGVPLRTEVEVERMFQLFSQHRLRGSDYQAMELLRLHYRNRKRLDINVVQTTASQQHPPIPQLSDFLSYIGFVPSSPGVLLRPEIEYLTGGWFEEWVYYHICNQLHPQQATLGVRIWRAGVRRRNELDVVFIHNNKLFVVECKTGVETERLFNEIVYKACALREALLGLSCHSYIFSLKDDDSGDLKRIASNMEISFFDKSVLTSDSILQKSIHSMQLLAV